MKILTTVKRVPNPEERIRIRPDGGGSRIDIRSKSRDGESDLGVNAKRIREFISKLKAPS